MAYELKEGQGSLFNHNPKGELSPTWEGKVKINGTLYRLAGWENYGKSNSHWISLRAEVYNDSHERLEAEQKAQAAATAAPKAAPMRAAAEDTEDLPF